MTVTLLPHLDCQTYGQTPPSTPAGATVGVPRRTLWLILAVGLLARLATLQSYLAAHPHTWLFSHPWEMGLVANSLTHGLGYSSPFGGMTGPTAIIAPGYPTLIAGVFLVFGAATPASAVAILLLQVLVSVMTIWLMMRVSAELFGGRVAVLAGLFWAVSLPLLWVPTIFWETSLSELALVGAAALALRCRRSPARGAWMLLGACCAVAGLVNPALLPSLVAVMGWVAYQSRGTGWRGPLVGALALLLLYSPWPVRNAVRFHAFIPLRSTVGLELYMGNRAGGNGRLDDALFPMFNRPELARYLAEGEVAYTRSKSAEAWAYIRSHPAAFIELSLRRCYRFWAGTGNVDGSPVLEAHALLTTLLGGVGLLVLCWRRRRATAALLALPLLLFPLPYYITHAEYRYRLNIDPLLTMLAAYAVIEMVVQWQQRGRAMRQSNRASS